MLRYKVTKNGVTTEEACSLREFYSPNSTVKPGTQIIGIFDPDEPDCEFKDNYEYFYGEEEEEFLDIEYKEIMVPNNKGGYDKVIQILNWQQLLLDNPSTSIPSSSNITKGPQLTPNSAVPKRQDSDKEKDRVQQVCPGPLSSKTQKEEKPSGNSAKRKFANPISKKPTADQKIINRILDRTELKTKITNESMEDLNFAVDSESANERIMVPNTSMSVCIQITDKLDKTKFVIPSNVKNRMYSALLQIIEEEGKVEFSKSENKIDCLQPVSPSKINCSVATINHSNNQVGIKSNKPKISYQQPSTSKQWMDQQPTTSKQSVVHQQPTTSKQSVVHQQPTTSTQSVFLVQPQLMNKQSVVPQQPTTSKQSVVHQQLTTSKQSVVHQQLTTSKQSVFPQQPTTSKQSVFLVQPQLMNKQSVVPQQPTTSKQSVVHQQLTTSKQSVVHQQLTTSKQSVFPQQPTTSTQSGVLVQPQLMNKQSVVPQQPTTSKQSVVHQQLTTSKQSVVHQQPTTSTQSVFLVQPQLMNKQIVVPQQPTTSKQSVVHQQLTTSKQSVVHQQLTTSKQSVFPQQPTTSTQSGVLVQPQLMNKQSVVPQQPTTSKQSVVHQQLTTSKQSVVHQQLTTSKQSVFPQQPTTSTQSGVLVQPQLMDKESVVPQQPTTSKQSVVFVQPQLMTKQNFVSQQPTTSKQSVVPQQPTTSKQSVVHQQPTTSKQSVVHQQPTTSTQSVFLVQPQLMNKQSVVPQQPTTSKQSVVHQQLTTSKQSVFPQQPTTSTQSVVLVQPQLMTKQNVVPQQPTTSKQSVFHQQLTTSKQSVVPQQPTASKQSVVPQQPTTSKQTVVPQQPTTSTQSVFLVQPQLMNKQSVVPQQPTTSKQSVVPQQPTTSKQNVVPQQPITSKQSVVPQQLTTSKQSVVPQQPTTSKQSVVFVQPQLMTKQNFVSQQPTTSKQSMVPQQPTTSKQSMVPQQPTTSKQSVVPQQHTTSKQSVVPQQLTTSKQNVVPQQPTTSKQSVVPQQLTTSKQSVVLVQPQLRTKQNFVPQQPTTSKQSVVLVQPQPLTRQSVVLQRPTTSKIATHPNQSKDNENEKDKDKDKDEGNMLIDDPYIFLISSDDEGYDDVEPHTNSDGDNYEDLKVKSQRKEECKQFAEFKNVDYESYPLTDEHLDGRVVTPVKICDYRMLNIDEFVNDSIVEFYLNYWYCRKLSLEDRMRTYIFNTFFYTSLSKRKVYDVKTKSRHDRVKKWTKKVNIFEKDFIFIPINENFHWFMAVICYPHLTGPVHYEDGTRLKTLYEDDFGDYKRTSPKPCEPYAERDEADGNTEDFRYYPNFSHDGKSTGNYKTDVENLKKKNRIPIKQPVILIFDSLNGHTARARIVATLREWIEEEYRTKHNGAERDFSLKSMKGTVVKVPQQPNYTDCGLFIMHYFQKFFECPIIDYSCPILHLENWFSIDDVSKNCLKRRDVQSIILKVMNEQGRSLPSGIFLPELRFSKPEQHNNVLTQTCQFQINVQHYQQIQNRQHYYNNQGGDINMELDNVDEEMYDEFEESENGQYPVDHHGKYAYHGNEYHQEDMETSQDDEGQYYVEVEVPWNDSQEGGDYQSESDFDMEQSNTFNGNEELYHSVHTPRNHNHLNMAGNNTPSYNENYDVDSDEEMDIEYIDV